VLYVSKKNHLILKMEYSSEQVSTVYARLGDNALRRTTDITGPSPDPKTRLAWHLLPRSSLS
jgi:ribosomal protein S10